MIIILVGDEAPGCRRWAPLKLAHEWMTCRIISLRWKGGRNGLDGSQETMRLKLNSRKLKCEEKRKSKKKTWEQYARRFGWQQPKRHTAQKKKDKAVKQTPENVKVCDEEAARCTEVMKTRVLRKQARKARADHLVKSSLIPRKIWEMFPYLTCLTTVA